MTSINNILHDDNSPAILTGHDTVSPIASPCPPNENDIEDGAIVSTYQLPYRNENPNDYFCHRNNLVETAIEECKNTIVFPEEDGQIVGSWILTEISYWDSEKERIIILTTKAVIIIKYDFIALKKKEFKRIPLMEIDTVVLGNLTYPTASVVPRLNGIANGVSTVVRECILDRLIQGSNSTMAGCVKNDEKIGPLNIKHFEPRNRNMRGVRLMWNKGVPLSFVKKWNPFDNSIPFITYSSHPLFWHNGETNADVKVTFDIENFSSQLLTTIEASQTCKIHHAPIILENYVGLTSLLHNKTSLGFFKVRGKFSF